MRWLANILRRAANGMDPPRKCDEYAPPIEYIHTGALLEEVAKRSDVYVLFHGRVGKVEGEQRLVKGGFTFFLPRSIGMSYIQMMLDEISKTMNAEGGE